MKIDNYKDEWIQIELERGEPSDLRLILETLRIDRIDAGSHLELATLFSFLEADTELASYHRRYDSVANCYSMLWKSPKVPYAFPREEYCVSMFIYDINPIKNIQTKFGYVVEHFELAEDQTLMDLYPMLRKHLTGSFRYGKSSASEPEALPG